jgi:hypothetical protein
MTEGPQVLPKIMIMEKEVRTGSEHCLMKSKKIRREHRAETCKVSFIRGKICSKHDQQEYLLSR